MLAAYAGHAELVRGLIQRGADPNKLNDLRQAPIAGAVFKREDEVVRVLVEARLLILGRDSQTRSRVRGCLVAQILLGVFGCA